METKNRFWRGVMVGVLVTAFACLVTVGASAGIYMFAWRAIGDQVEAQAGQPGPSGETEKEGLDLDAVSAKLSELQAIVDSQYLFEDQIDEAQEEAGIYWGFLSGLNDAYAAYYTPEELASLLDETNGSYCGIGALVSQNVQTGVCTIIRVFEGSPAEAAGILPGDVIWEVDGEAVTGVDLSLVVNNYVKGEEGTAVTVTVFREDAAGGDGEYLDLEVTRAPIDVQTVSGKMLTDEIGYISIMEFDVITASQFQEEADELTEAGMKKLILDLRDNPGGEITGTIGTADYILEDGGTILTIEDRNGTQEVYTAEDGHQMDLPIVVLVNGNSASAAEVLTGALKDYGAATVVGTQTFGKGIVQTIIPLSDGSAVKLTTAHYYTPDGHDIHEKGIEPDVVEELSEEAAKEAVIPEELDNQLQKAVEILEQAAPRAQ